MTFHTLAILAVSGTLIVTLAAGAHAQPEPAPTTPPPPPAAAPAPPPGLTTPDASAITPPSEVSNLLARVHRRYGTARTATLEFTERYVSKLTNRAIEETGTLWLATPGRMRWEYKAPEEKLFIVDGESSWFFVPEDKVAYRMTTRASEARRLPAMFLAGRGDLARDYDAQLEAQSRDRLTLRLTPKQVGEDYDYLMMEVDAASAAITALRVVDALGNLTAFEFRGESSPAPAPEGAFEFSPPRGVEVVDPQP